MMIKEIKSFKNNDTKKNKMTTSTHRSSGKASPTNRLSSKNSSTNRSSGKASSTTRPSGNDAYINRARGMISITVRSILLDKKTMAVGAILLLLLAIPLFWLNNPPSGEDDTAMDMFLGMTVMLYLQFFVLYVCFL